jgi:hypothetical protein
MNLRIEFRLISDWNWDRVWDEEDANKAEAIYMYIFTCLQNGFNAILYYITL